jgi:hypothetical protein
MVVKVGKVDIDGKCYEVIFVKSEQNPHSHCNQIGGECDKVVIKIDDNFSAIHCKSDSEALKAFGPRKMKKLFDTLPNL